MLSTVPTFTLDAPRPVDVNSPFSAAARLQKRSQLSKAGRRNALVPRAPRASIRALSLENKGGAPEAKAAPESKGAPESKAVGESSITTPRAALAAASALFPDVPLLDLGGVPTVEVAAASIRNTMMKTQQGLRQGVRVLCRACLCLFG